MSADEVATLAIQLEARQFNSGLEQARRQAAELGVTTGKLTTQTDHLTGSLKSAGAALLSLYAGNKAVGFFKDATQAASTFREDLAQFQHVMRNVRAEADSLVKSLTSDAFGRTELQAMRMTMNMTSMAKGMGMTDKAALKLSGEFAKLSVDIGSFMAKDPDAVMGAFESALMGNTMALRSYGVFLDEATMKTALLENSKKGLTFATDREAKAFAILSAAQKQQADAIGDFAIESQGFSNQLKQMGAGLEDLKIKFGKGLLEPARQGAVAINSVIKWINALDSETFAFATRLSAVTMGFGAAKIAVSALSHVVTALTGKTFANTGAVAAETAAVSLNTKAWAANAFARKRATRANTAARRRIGVSGARMNAAQYYFMDEIGGSFGMTGPTDFSRTKRRPERMPKKAMRAFESAPGTVTSMTSVVGQGTLTAVGAGGAGAVKSVGAFGMTGTAAVAVPVAAIASIGASVVKTGYDLKTGEKDFKSFGGAVNTLLGTISAGPEMILRSLGYYDMWAKWGEKSVEKPTVRDAKTGETIDHDEYVRRFRERLDIKQLDEEAGQRIANGGYTDAELKRKGEQKKHYQDMFEYNRFVAEQEKAARYDKMDIGRRRFSVGTDLLNVREELGRALRHEDYGKAKELVKRRFELQAEIGRLDKTIEREKTRAEEEKKRATEEKLAMAKQAQNYAQSTLYDVQYQSAGRSGRVQMATQAFWKASKDFDKLESFEEKQKTAEKMTKFWEQVKADAANGLPTWNAPKSTTTGAVDSRSTQARELQNRVFNDISKASLDQLKKIAGMEKQVIEALKAILGEAKKEITYIKGTN